MPTFKILPFKPDSTGAAILARSLPAELIDVSRYLPNVVTNGVHVLNWGCGYSDAKVSANQPKAICNAVSKTRAFKLFDQWDIKHPEYSSSKRVAKDWYENGSYVYHRSTMEGECGRGISVKHKGTINIHPDREWLEDEDSNHYTKGFPIHREFRVHVAFDKVIEVNEKKKRNGTNPDPLIRSHADWVFCVYNLAPYPDIIKSASIKAVAALGLDFGGVDIAIDINNNYTVFEVNTAPWINRESTTVAYTNAFKEHFA